MAQLHESAATLRFRGDDLVPQEITKLLGVAPTLSYAKGEAFGQSNIRRSGGWLLRAQRRVPEDLSGQVEEILDQLTDDLEVWAQLGRRFTIDLFCSLFMRESNEGLSLSSKALRALGERGIALGLDIYDGSPRDA